MTHEIDTRDKIIADLLRRLDGALAEVERLKGELQAEKQSAMESIGAWQITAGEWGAKCHHLQAEVERLRNHADHIEEESGWRDCMALHTEVERLKAHTLEQRRELRTLRAERDRAQHDAVTVLHAYRDRKPVVGDLLQRVEVYRSSIKVVRAVASGEHWPTEGEG
jgi:chromosome segregation ATPase